MRKLTVTFHKLQAFCHQVRNAIRTQLLTTKGNLKNLEIDKFFFKLNTSGIRLTFVRGQLKTYFKLFQPRYSLLSYFNPGVIL